MSRSHAIPFIFCTAMLGMTPALPTPAGAAVSPPIGIEDWYWGPNNQWSWHHMRRIFPSADIGRGNGAPTSLPDAHRDLSAITFFDPEHKDRRTIGEMLAATHTDGFIVLKDGRILAEQYFNGMTPDTPHLLMSITKSVVGTMAGILVADGRLRPEAQVIEYLPELKDSVYGKATVREVLDMTVSARMEGADPYEGIDKAAGWLVPDAASAPGLRAYLLTLKQKDGPDGVRFQYLDPSPLVISWIMERLTRTDFSALLQETIWSRIGAQSDAYVVLDHHQVAYTTPGLNMTLRDLARFGEMMLGNGKYDGRQIVPRQWVDDIRAGGSASAWQAARHSEDRTMPGYADGSYRSFWWVTGHGCGRYAGIGLGGQVLIIDPVANMVIVKFSSAPSPQAGESITRSTFYGADAIIRALSGHGC